MLLQLLRRLPPTNCPSNISLAINLKFLNDINNCKISSHDRCESKTKIRNDGNMIEGELKLDVGNRKVDRTGLLQPRTSSAEHEDGVRERDKGMEKHHTDEPFKLLTPETTRLSAFWLIPGIVHPVVESSPSLLVLSHPLLSGAIIRVWHSPL